MKLLWFPTTSDTFYFFVFSKCSLAAANVDVTGGGGFQPQVRSVRCCRDESEFSHSATWVQLKFSTCGELLPHNTMCPNTLAQNVRLPHINNDTVCLAEQKTSWSWCFLVRVISEYRKDFWDFVFCFFGGCHMFVSMDRLDSSVWQMEGVLWALNEQIFQPLEQQSWSLAYHSQFVVCIIQKDTLSARGGLY